MPAKSVWQERFEHLKIAIHTELNWKCQCLADRAIEKQGEVDNTQEFWQLVGGHKTLKHLRKWSDDIEIMRY